MELAGHARHVSDRDVAPTVVEYLPASQSVHWPHPVHPMQLQPPEHTPLYAEPEVESQWVSVHEHQELLSQAASSSSQLKPQSPVVTQSFLEKLEQQISSPGV